MKVSETFDLKAEGENIQYEATISVNNSLYVLGSYFSKKMLMKNYMHSAWIQIHSK
jgi:hypothetical protein